MKKSGVLVIGLFLIFMIGGVSAECQYKQNVSTGIFVNNLYDNEGNRYTHLVEINNFKALYTGGFHCYCTNSFDIKNKIGKTITIKVKYQGFSIANYFEKDYNISGLTIQAVIDSFEIACGGTCGINPDSVSIQYLSNSEVTSSIEEIKNESCKQCLGKDCLNDGQNCTYDFECGSNICSNSGNTAGHCISERSNLEIRLSILESWKTTINNTISTIQTAISNILLTLTDHNTQITALENKTCSCQANQTATFPNYFKYLSSSERKDLVCGYAQDNHLTTINDLGWNCDITYKQSSRGERASCKCKPL
jgi:hypothetical protein